MSIYEDFLVSVINKAKIAVNFLEDLERRLKVSIGSENISIYTDEITSGVVAATILIKFENECFSGGVIFYRISVLVDPISKNHIDMYVENKSDIKFEIMTNICGGENSIKDTVVKIISLFEKEINFNCD